jgi:hypothetical protein
MFVGVPMGDAKSAQIGFSCWAVLAETAFVKLDIFDKTASGGGAPRYLFRGQKARRYA